MADELVNLNDLDALLTYKDEKEKELQAVRDNREVIEAEKYSLQLSILEHQRAIKDLEIAKNKIDQSLNKARAECARLSLIVERVNSKYWNLKKL